MVAYDPGTGAFVVVALNGDSLAEAAAHKLLAEPCRTGARATAGDPGRSPAF